MGRIVENTDVTGRLVAGTKSLTRWHQFETDRLAAEDRLFNEALQKETDPAKRAELRVALEQNSTEQRKLERGWEHSSLRRRLTPDKSAGNYQGIEQRLLMSGRDRLKSSEPAAEDRDQKSKLKLSGHAAVFDKQSLDLGGFIEIIKPGAFSDALKTSDVRALINHDPNLLLGRSTSKTLRLYEDRIGLLYYVDLIDGDGISEGITSRVNRRDITGCSFSFIVAEDTWQLAEKYGELDLRIIIKIAELFDVGPVTYPAYPDTSVTVLDERKAASQAANYDNEWFLREQAAEDDLLMQQIERQSLADKREVERKYRYAGRIINRNKSASLC